MISVLVVDDEKPSRDELVYLLSKIDTIDIVGEAEDGIEALKQISRNNPDIVFLDIQMPEMTGIELAEYLQNLEQKPYVIFTTAYDGFAIKAFEVGALDYLLKPYESERLVLSIKRFTEAQTVSTEDFSTKVTKLIEVYNKKESILKPFHVIVVNGDNFLPIKPENISVLIASGKKTRIITCSREYEDSKTITYFEELLKKHNFFKTHRSYLINLNHIEKIGLWFNNTYQLTMDYFDDAVPVSRSKVHEFRRLMSIEKP